MAALDAGVDTVLGADVALIREKSLRLGALLVRMVEERASRHPLALLSPQEPERRGSQVSFRHAHAYPVMQALIARGIIGDFRAPDILRFGITPLYTRYADAWDAVTALVEVLDSREWDQPHFHRRAAVT